VPENPESEEATDAFDAVVESYWESEDPKASRVAGKALVQRASALVGVGLYDEAITAAEEAIVRLGCSPEPADSDLFRSAVAGLADGLTARGAAMVREAHYDEGIEALDSVIDQFQDDRALRLRRAVALALSHKATALAHTGRVAEAFEAREYMVMHYGEVGVSVPELGGDTL
jgi:tetratricopeptide (TPR) repeat protein